MCVYVYIYIHTHTQSTLTNIDTLIHQRTGMMYDRHENVNRSFQGEVIVFLTLFVMLFFTSQLFFTFFFKILFI